MIIYTKPFSQQDGVGCPHLCPLGRRAEAVPDSESGCLVALKSLFPVHQGGAHPLLSLSGPCVLSVVSETLAPAGHCIQVFFLPIAQLSDICPVSPGSLL